MIQWLREKPMEEDGNRNKSKKGFEYDCDIHEGKNVLGLHLRY